MEALIRNFIVLQVCLVALTSCATTDNVQAQPEALYELGTVVEAVQYAIDVAASDEAWSSTEAEKAHWKKACTASKEKTANSCMGMVKTAGPLCEARCNGNCSPVDKLFCNQLITSKDRLAICSGEDALDSWCGHAEVCARAEAEEARICGAASSIFLPKLKSATLALKVEQGQKNGAGVSLFFVTFGGSKSRSSANTITLSLLPRIRDTNYGDVLPVPNKTELVISEDAKKLAGNLEELIRTGVQAGTLESKDDTGRLVTPPLALSGLKVELALSVDSEGKFSIGKEWDSVPASIEVGSEKKRLLSNVLVLEYMR